MRKRILSVLIPLLILSACTDSVTNVDLPEQDPRYVMHTYLSPEDSIIRVVLGRSRPVFSSDNINDTSWKAGAQVSINGISLSRDSFSNCWSIDANVLNLQAGQTCTALASFQDGTSIQGSCIIPASVNQSLEFIGYDSVEYTWDPNYIEYYARFRFTDIAGESNYYQVGALISYFIQGEGDTLTYFQHGNLECLFSDNGHDGDVNNGRLYILYSGLDPYAPVITSVKLYLFTTDKLYYDYHKALYSQNNDPFSEPVIINSNVEHGLGAVAAYRSYCITIL